MVGIPPFSGFISKWYLGLGALEAGQSFFLIVLLVSSFLNGLYYLPIVVASFFRKETVDVQKQPIPLSAQIALIILSVATIFFGLFSNIPIDYITPAVQGLFGL